ncbi:hypothetical protein HAX54_037229, partial [Datura stramonium]|nr:hypothetical protein [Datura stramonium]
MSQVLDHDDTPINYFGEAFKSCEEDPFTSCLVVITRNSKVLHSKPHMTIEKEIHDDEKLYTNIDVAPREMNDETSSEEVNEELKVEVPFPFLKTFIFSPLFSQWLKKKQNDERIE